MLTPSCPDYLWRCPWRLVLKGEGDSLGLRHERERFLHEGKAPGSLCCLETFWAGTERGVCQGWYRNKRQVEINIGKKQFGKTTAIRLTRRGVDPAAGPRASFSSLTQNETDWAGSNSEGGPSRGTLGALQGVTEKKKQTGVLYEESLAREVRVKGVNVKAAGRLVERPP